MSDFRLCVSCQISNFDMISLELNNDVNVTKRANNVTIDAFIKISELV